jgi:hypothetical protein
MGEELSISQMEQILLEEPHIVAIHQPEEWKIPKIDRRILSYDSEYNPIDSLEGYLRMRCIEDDFGGNHAARREWKTKMSRKYDWFIDYLMSNALRFGNRIPTIVNDLSILKMTYKGSDQDKFQDKCDEIYESFVQPSKSAVAYAKKIQQAIYDLLFFLSEQSPAT